MAEHRERLEHLVKSLERQFDEKYEPYLDKKYRDKALCYPPTKEFVFSYNCLEEHLKLYWNHLENNINEDRDSFARTSREFRELVMNAAGCITIGDTMVLDKLDCRVLDSITPIEVHAMFDDQRARERIHQITYSRWLDIDDYGTFCRTRDFSHIYMIEFERLSDKFVNLTKLLSTEEKAGALVPIIIYFIMLCENIMFAPVFQILCYMSTLSVSQRITNANLLVMRDEHVHYLHAQGLLKRLALKIERDDRIWILKEFVEATEAMMYKIVGTYDDGRMNRAHCAAHLRHVVHVFRMENDLYASDTEMLEAQKKWGDSPAEDYMRMPTREIKNNLMETSSTVYDNEHLLSDIRNIDMSFNF